MEVSTIKISEKNYAIILPGQVAYALDATLEEVEEFKKELISNYKEEEKQEGDSVSLAIITTYDCNLRCAYCYSKGGESKEKLNMADVEVALLHLQKKGKKTLDLYLVGGGEPLLDFTIIKEIEFMAKSVFENVRFNIVTNGMFGDEVLFWIVKEKASVRISFDGVAQNHQRRTHADEGSSNIVVNNIKELVNRGVEPIVQCIVTSDSADKMIDGAKLIRSMGVRVIKFEPAIISQNSRGEKNLQVDPKEYSKNLLKLIDYVVENELDIMIDTGFFTKPSEGSYCGIAKGNFVLTPQGKITSCVEVGKTSDLYSEKIMIGDITENKIEINHENIEFLKMLNYRNQIGGCKECELRMICLGGCPMSNIWENGLPLKKSPFTCVISKIIVPEILNRLIKNDYYSKVLIEDVDRKYL